MKKKEFKKLKSEIYNLLTTNKINEAVKLLIGNPYLQSEPDFYNEILSYNGYLFALEQEKETYDKNVIQAKKDKLIFHIFDLVKRLEKHYENKAIPFWQNKNKLFALILFVILVGLFVNFILSLPSVTTYDKEDWFWTILAVISVPILIFFSNFFFKYLDKGNDSESKKEFNPTPFEGDIETYEPSNVVWNDEILYQITTIKQRINNEIKSLNRKANVNLAIGVFTTFISVAFLISITFAFKDDSYESWLDFMSKYLPRFTLVVFVEVFSFYFLRLYKSNLSDIKYYQNEMTDIDFRLLSLKVAMSKENNEEQLNSIINEFLKVDHNKILKEGETTADLTTFKQELDFHKGISEKLLGMIEPLNIFKKQDKENNNS